MNRTLLQADIDVDTGVLTVVAPEKDEVLALFAHLEDELKVPMSIDIDANKSGVALLMTLATVIQKMLLRHRVETLEQLMKLTTLPNNIPEETLN